jgi:hypothetical protein
MWLIVSEGKFCCERAGEWCVIYIGASWVRGQGVEFSAPRADNSSAFHITHSSSGCIEFNYQLVKTTALGSDEYENSGGRAGDPPK